MPMATRRCLGMLLKQYGHLSKAEDIFLCSATMSQNLKEKNPSKYTNTFSKQHNLQANSESVQCRVFQT